MYFFLQVPECFLSMFLKEFFKKVEMDRDILLPHSDNIEEVFFFLEKKS